MSFTVDNNYEWATHQPLLKAVLKLYKPEFALELGAGFHSTLALKEAGINYLSIDDDKEWAGYMVDAYKTNVVWHDTGMKNSNMPFTDLKIGEIEKLADYYKAIPIEVKKNILFVDHFTCGRIIAINTLKSKFDAIIFHDCQPEGQKAFSYDLIDYKGWNDYYLKSISSWTCFMVKQTKDKGFSQLREIIQPFLFEFKMKYPEIPYMELTDQY